MKAVQQERIKEGKVPQTQYMPGDLILWNSRVLWLGMDKDCIWKGPYEVLSQQGNAVYCEHTTNKTDSVFHVDEIKMFHGSKEQAERLSRHDDKQVVVNRVHWHKGDHHRPMSMVFQLELENGSVQENYLQAEASLRNNQAIQDYCRHPNRRYLEPLLYTGNDKEELLANLKTAPLHFEPHEGQEVFVNLRFYNDGCFWYDEKCKNLPGMPEAEYYVNGVMKKNFNRDGSINKRSAWSVHMGLFHDSRFATPIWFNWYVHDHLPEGASLLTAELANLHQEVYEEL